METKQTNTQLVYTENPSLCLKEIQESSASLARWIALYEAVNIIADKGEERGIKLEDIDFKPLDIKDYINNVEDIINRKILADMYNIHIHASEESKQSEEVIKI